jgi:hypothetical protein
MSCWKGRCDNPPLKMPLPVGGILKSPQWTRSGVVAASRQTAPVIPVGVLEAFGDGCIVARLVASTAPDGPAGPQPVREPEGSNTRRRT